MAPVGRARHSPSMIGGLGGRLLGLKPGRGAAVTLEAVSARPHLGRMTSEFDSDRRGGRRRRHRCRAQARGQQRLVLLLEASQRLGGRAYTRDLGGYPLDFGCEWLHSGTATHGFGIAEHPAFRSTGAIALDEGATLPWMSTRTTRRRRGGPMAIGRSDSVRSPRAATVPAMPGTGRCLERLRRPSRAS